MSATDADRRLHPRVALLLAARFGLGREATLLDVSLGGARLEHQGALRPGIECHVGFVLNDEFYLFSARVIWSKPVQEQDRADELLFHSGLAFERVPEAAKPLLATLVSPVEDS